MSLLQLLNFLFLVINSSLYTFISSLKGCLSCLDKILFFYFHNLAISLKKSLLSATGMVLRCILETLRELALSLGVSAILLCRRK